MPGSLDIRLRLASAPSDPSLSDGLQAGIGDPLWLLVRQWQFGELSATDGGSPAWVRARGTVRHLTRYLDRLPDGTAGALLDTDAVPLERVIENEWAPPDGASSPAEAVRVGTQYLRLLARLPGQATLASYRTGLLGAYPIRTDGLTDDDALRLLADHAPDGLALVADLRHALAQQPPALPPQPDLGPADPQAVLSAATTLLAWFDATTGRDVPASAAWVNERLEYQAALAAPGTGATGDPGLTLAATEYDDGRLDWSSFDVAPGTSIGATVQDAGGQQPDFAFTSLPTPATYPGMPNAQFWEFEDAAVDFGAVSAAPEELTTLLVIEYALRYGNDFFVVPMTLDVGSVCQLSSLVVADTFGERILIEPIQAVDGPSGRFRLFESEVIGNRDAGAPQAPRCTELVVFPTADIVLDSPVQERVALVLDQLASTSWAIERTAPDASGRPADRDAAAAASRSAVAGVASADPSAVTYLLRTQVADNFYPLLPDAADVTRLRLARLEALPGQPAQSAPWGILAAGLASAAVPAEEVTAAGALVQRRYRYTRWIDGRHHLWVGRTRAPGQGGIDSGLKFDVPAP
jgi:hypothetical protein